jgi:hypothetical protein
MLCAVLLGAAAARAGEPTDAELLTDDKIGRWLVYLDELAGGAGAVGKIVGQVGTQVGAGKDAKEVKLDPADSQELATAGQKGLEKSALTQQEISRLSRILTPYFGKRTRATKAKQELAGKPGGMAEIYEKQVQQGEAARAELEQHYGRAALAAADRHEARFAEVQEKLTNAMLKKPPHKD